MQRIVVWPNNWIPNIQPSHAQILHFPGAHSADNISRMIKNAINEWDLSEKLYLDLWDNGANIVKGIKTANLSNESCFLQTLQLVVSDTLTSQRVVSDNFNR